MNSITSLWLTSKETFETKALPQILSFAGDGRLKDANSTSTEFRELLQQIPTKLIKNFANSCLIDKFEDSGFALQDIINQIGFRLGFEIEHGLYRGKQNDIGFDGIWKSKAGHNIIVEVKTTDAYRINLDTIAEYRNKLISQGRVNKEQSSILIVVGRQDTGDLEAQIRGSRHAWDIRLLSTDSLLDLLVLKENLNDTKTIQQINELLKPKEYTRIDKLIEIIFLASQDVKLDDEAEEIIEKVDEPKLAKNNESRLNRVGIRDECVKRVKDHFKLSFNEESRIAYSNKQKSLGFVCLVSKAYKQGGYNKYWYGFHPYQKEFLIEFREPYVVFGCGLPQNTFLIPYKEFEPLTNNMNITEKDNRMYWHVHIIEKQNKFLITLTKNMQSEFDISKYKV
jgi:hypothetical protein